MKKILFVMAAGVVYIFISIAGSWIGGVPKGSAEYSRFQVGGIEKSLPIIKIPSSVSDYGFISGSLVLQIPSDLQRPAVYIPNYQGKLKLWIDGRAVGPASFMQEAGVSVAVTHDGIAKLDVGTTGKLVNFKFLLEPVDTTIDARHLTMSKIYVDEFSVFEKISRKKSIYYDVFRPALVLSFFLSIVLLAALISVRALDLEALPLLSFIVFVTAQFSGSLHFVWGGFTEIHKGSFSFALFGMMMLNMYVNSLKGLAHSRAEYFLSAGLLVYGVLSLTISHFVQTKFSLTYVNSIIHFPLMLIGFLLVAWRAFSTKDNINETKLFCLSVVIAIWALTLADSLIRYTGFIDLNVYLPSISGLLLYFVLGYIFSIDIVAARNRLRARNAEIEAALAIQENKLNEQFLETVRLKEREVTANSYERIHNDLHDGILTYLFSIMSLSGRIEGSEAVKIKSLSQFCLNEIRVILSSGVVGSTPLILSLANYRHNIFDTISELGVATNWDMKCLVDLAPTDLRFNLEVVRIIQEAVNNAVQRSGCAKLSVAASFFAEGKAIRFEIVNEGGQTFSEKRSEGVGLKSMSSRVSRLGGHFSIIPLDGGARLTFIIPL